MNRRPGPDLLIYVLAAVATVIGLLAIWDSGYARAAVNDQVLPREFWMQGIYAVLAVLLGWGASKVPAQGWKKLAVPGLILSVALLVLVELPGIGKEIGGARRWIGVGPMTVQPAEFAKLGAILFLAWILSTRPVWKEPKVRNFAERLDRVWIPKLGRGLAILIPVGTVVFLIEREPDMATAMVIVFSMFALFVLGKVTWKSIVTLGVCGIAMIGGMLLKEGYRMERITNHAARWESQNIEATGYQTTQSEMALAAGGVIGVGLGEGRAKHKLPAPTTDFILATIGEEFGLIGSMGVILLLGVLTMRIFQLGMTRKDDFDKLALCGIAAWIGVQSATNIMMANGYFPPIGIPLPFFSYGGSSLLALWMAVGVSQSILSRKARVKASEGEETDRRPRSRTRTREYEDEDSYYTDRVASVR